jgi:hypothetical protein
VVVRGAIVIALVALALVGGGCNAGGTPDDDRDARALYPDLAALYAGDHGMYRGCAPNGGVCHNSREFPDLHTVGAIVDNIGRDCNAKRDRPETLHDLCERPGDLLRVGGTELELAWIEATAESDPASPRDWRLHLREPATSVTGPVAVLRDGVELYRLRYASVDIALDAADPTVVTVHLPASPAVVDPEDPDLGTYLAEVLVAAGIPGDPMSIQVGDANRNGTFGAELGGRIIKPGDPARSYLMRRLTDPTAGPLMPRANCCFWTKAALRALQCWITGLAPDGANALAPIDYDRCGPAPSVELLYPDPGPECEASGLCPVEALPSGGDDFPSIYSDLIVAKCAGSGCHNEEPVGGVDFATEQRAFDTLSARVVPGDPAASLLYRRLSPELCTGECRTMPLGRAPLSADELARVGAWIEAGALRD